MTAQVSTKKVFLILSYICIASVAGAMITPALPQMAAYFSVSSQQVGNVVVVFLLGYVLGQLVYSTLAARYSTKVALQIGLTIAIVGIALCLLSSLYHCFMLCLIGRFVAAFGEASGLSCTFMMIHQCLPEHQAKQASAYSVLAFTLGIGVAVLLGGFVTQLLGWRAVFIMLIIYIVTMFWLTKYLPNTKVNDDAESLLTTIFGLFQALKQAQLWMYASVIGLCSAIGYVYSAAGPIIAHQWLGLLPAQYGLWNIFNMIGMGLSGMTGAKLIKHISCLKMIGYAIVGVIFTLAGLWVFNLMYCNSAIIFFSLTALLYFFGGWCFPAGAQLVMQSAAHKTHAASAKSFINMGSATLAVFILGWIPGSRLHAMILILTLLVMVVSALLLISGSKKLLKQG